MLPGKLKVWLDGFKIHETQLLMGFGGSHTLTGFVSVSLDMSLLFQCTEVLVEYKLHVRAPVSSDPDQSEP